MLAQTFQRVAQDTYWLYELSIDELDQKVVHIPLIYASNMYVELEAYAKAMKKFPLLIDEISPLKVRTVDDCVVKFESAAYEQFKVDLLVNLLSGGLPSLSLYQKGLVLLSRFSRNCLLAEKEILENNQVGQMFEEAYHNLLDIISLNFANPVYEAGYSFLKETENENDFFKQSTKDHLSVTFSHLGWFNAKLNAIRNQQQDRFHSISEYFWNCSFLAAKASEQSIDESVDHVNQLFESDYSLKDFLDNYINTFPDFEQMIQEKVGEMEEKLSDVPNIFEMLELLQLLEEYRHYWQARLFRALKFAQDSNELETMSFSQLVQDFHE